MKGNTRVFINSFAWIFMGLSFAVGVSCLLLGLLFIGKLGILLAAAASLIALITESKREIIPALIITSGLYIAILLNSPLLAAILIPADAVATTYAAYQDYKKAHGQ